MKLKIYVGTITGNADYVAQAIQMDAADLVTDIEVTAMDALRADAFAEDALYLICTSTYGSGDVPDNARALYEDLQAAAPNLSTVRYGVIALGDRTYLQTFCFGGHKFDARLQDRGAQRLGEVFEHDASSGTMAEEVATAWARAWLTETALPSLAERA
jgi:MioC protein